MSDFDMGVPEAVAREIAKHLAEFLTPSIIPEYIDTEAAAAYLSLSKQQLEIWRSYGEGPPYIKLSRLVRYRRADLDEWMAARRRNHTAESR